MNNLPPLQIDALIIGAGPAGLMAAQELGRAGCRVLIADAMPSPARKLLMAGKSGLNLTKNEPMDAFLQNFTPLPHALKTALEAFGPQDIKAWSEELGQDVFTGSTGRVFPKTMKASPLLRAWLMRLDSYDVELKRRWAWQGFEQGQSIFETPEGTQAVEAKTTVLAMGGASWAKLGSNGAWARALNAEMLAPFAGANAALSCEWSDYMQPHLGAAIKNVRLSSGPYVSQGEFVLSQNGLEGGGIYSVSRGVREGHPLSIDLLPNWSVDQINAALKQRKPKESLSNSLRKRLKLTPAKIALLQEFQRPLPKDLAPVIKALNIPTAGLRPMDEAISTAGGLRFDALSETLEMTSMSGVFACGEMLDWEAPTGGYLLSGCLATGRTAGRAASAVVQASRGE
jgi:uncharacterized flavoprotein (TIGR03862 family)